MAAAATLYLLSIAPLSVPSPGTWRGHTYTRIGEAERWHLRLAFPGGGRTFAAASCRPASEIKIDLEEASVEMHFYALLERRLLVELHAGPTPIRIAASLSRDSIAALRADSGAHVRLHAEPGDLDA